MIYRCLLIVATGITMWGNVQAQSGVPGSFTLNESLIESIESVNGEAADYESLLNELEELQKNPLDLNTATRGDFEKIPFLTDFQISSLIDYRKEKGRLLSVYELQVIYGFTPDIIEMLLPFVTVPGISKLQSDTAVFRNVRHQAVIRVQRILEKQDGFIKKDDKPGKAYPGSPWLLNAHYELSAGQNLKAAFTVEKDPGEDLFRSSNRAGFDFNSGYVLLSGRGKLKTAVIGDYRLAFGQGLTLFSGNAPGKSSLSLNTVKRQDAVKPFNSNDENNFFRGAAASAGFGKFSGSVFISVKNRDANITDTIDGKIYFSSLREDGYHRTSSEISDEKSVKETAAGANIGYRNNFMKAGSTLVYYRTDKYLEPGNELKDIYDFSGNSLVDWGFDYLLNLPRFQFFGETSTGNSSWATIDGLLFSLNKYAAVSVLYRKFGKGFYARYSSAFSEGSEDSNEEGFYTGLVLHPLPHLKISGYADFYRFPWLKYKQSAPCNGNDYLLQADYPAGKKTTMYLRFKFKNDPVDILRDSSNIPEVSEMQHSGVRYHISYAVSSVLTMQDRVEYSFSNVSSGNSTDGYMVYHDIAYRIPKAHIQLNLRAAWFKTADYATRIYAYENDLSSGYSFSPLYGNGLRSYIMASWKISQQVAFTFRYSNTHYYDRESIGTGYDEIKSDSKNDIKFRLSVTF
ncbi:MAG TPA: helix-hairpin-helix domain-containing protein [Bacteroidales bacterium]|nr:helix-hairpin-helix domain-containing protein [Bacteroidales bacterium]